MTTATTTRDGQRQRLYDAEQQVAVQLRLATEGARTVRVAGSTLVVPLERRFGDLAGVQRYLDVVRGTTAFRSAFPRAAAAPLRARARRGSAAAHYEPPGTVAVPFDRAGAWAARELVVLHELAHHAAHHDLLPGPAHGPAYAGALVRLVGDVIGPEIALLLTAALHDHDVRVAHLANGEG